MKEYTIRIKFKNNPEYQRFYSSKEDEYTRTKNNLRNALGQPYDSVVELNMGYRSMMFKSNEVENIEFREEEIYEAKDVAETPARYEAQYAEFAPGAIPPRPAPPPMIYDNINQGEGWRDVVQAATRAIR